MCAPSTWQDQTVRQISASYLCVMQLCVYVFRIGFLLYVPKNGFFGGFEGEDVKILCSDPPKSTTLREYASVAVSRVKIGSTA